MLLAAIRLAISSLEKNTHDMNRSNEESYKSKKDIPDWREALRYLQLESVNDIAMAEFFYISSFQYLTRSQGFGHDYTAAILAGLYKGNVRSAYLDPYILGMLKAINYGFDQNWTSKLQQYAWTKNPGGKDHEYALEILNLLFNSSRGEQLYQKLCSIQRTVPFNTSMIEGWRDVEEVLMNSMR
ncbi:MAG: hypothetical protein K6G84_08115 [Lachnospiraceae bacterium]|nr:hypothetical protein [Lachnospiraceae bacterium]